MQVVNFSSSQFSSPCVKAFLSHQSFFSSRWDYFFSPDETISSIMKQGATIKLIVWHFSATTGKQSAWCVDNILISRYKIASFKGFLRQTFLLILSGLGWLVDLRYLAFRVSQLTWLTKRTCLEIWSGLEDSGDVRRNFMTNARRFMSFDMSHELFNMIHADFELLVLGAIAEVLSEVQINWHWRH